MMPDREIAENMARNYARRESRIWWRTMALLLALGACGAISKFVLGHPIRTPELLIGGGVGLVLSVVARMTAR